MSLQVGGAREAAKAAEYYLKMLGKSILYCGKSGNGQAAKASQLCRSHYLLEEVSLSRKGNDYHSQNDDSGKPDFDRHTIAFSFELI